MGHTTVLMRRWHFITAAIRRWTFNVLFKPIRRGKVAGVMPGKFKLIE